MSTKYVICMLKYDWTEAGYGFCIVDDKHHGNHAVSCYSSGGKTIGISFYMSNARHFNSIMEAKKYIDDYKLPLNRSDSDGYRIYEIDDCSYSFKLNFIDYKAISHKAYITNMSLTGKYSTIEGTKDITYTTKDKIIEYLEFLEKNKDNINEVRVDGNKIDHMHILSTDFSFSNYTPKTIKEVYNFLYAKRGKK